MMPDLNFHHQKKILKGCLWKKVVCLFHAFEPPSYLVVGYSCWHIGCHVPSFILPVPNNILYGKRHIKPMYIFIHMHILFVLLVYLIPSSRPFRAARLYPNGEYPSFGNPGSSKIVTASQCHRLEGHPIIVQVSLKAVFGMYKPNHTSISICPVNWRKYVKQ